MSSPLFWHLDWEEEKGEAQILFSPFQSLIPELSPPTNSHTILS